MRRVVVHVEEAHPAGGWLVAVRTTDPGTGVTTDLAAPYPMAATVVGGRRVPATPGDRTPTGEPHGALCAGDGAQAAELLRRIRRQRPQECDVRTYGRWLFECLLGPAWPAIRVHTARERAVELALRWPAEATDLHRMVWEAMRDDRAPLAGHPDVVVAITRLVPAAPQPVRRITGMPSVLFATSVALTDPTIRPGAMYMGLLQELDATGRCRARAALGVSRDDLHDACARWAPDVVHLVAHGELLPGGRGALMLRGDGDGEREADAEALLAAVTAGGRRPVAVALSACNTASPGNAADTESAADPADPTDAAPLAAQLVARGIPIVSAMAGEIGEQACRLYTRRLASDVHSGKPVVVASAHARRAALIASTAPSTDIDWALPALFLGEYVDPYGSLVDATRAKELTRLGNALQLRHEPVYIGRGGILASVDDALNEPDSGSGVVAAMVRGTSHEVGGTRLLQEIGWRALRDGHVPLLLGPYPDATHSPTRPRALVDAILRKVVTVMERLEVAPFVPLVLCDGLSAAEEATLRTAVEGEEKLTRARAALRKQLGRYRAETQWLDPATVRDLLADDLRQLADGVAARWGEPFGDRTRVLLLCDDVHRWSAPPLSGVGFLLEMLEDATSGLGRPDRPYPVVFTASTTEDDGKTVADWCETARRGLRWHQMEDLTPDELVVGYQWVLLHPWTSRAAEDKDLYGTVYTPVRDAAADWEEILRSLGGRPTVVEDRLYAAAKQGHMWRRLRRDDDEQAWRTYVENNPGYGL